MKSEIIYKNNDATWVVLGRDPNKPDYIIDTNEYIIVSNGNTIILDPGSTEIFPEVVSSISKFVSIESIKYIFGSHQDPDILSSLSMWQAVCSEAITYVPWTWTSFITHFGSKPEKMVAIPDEGCSIELSDGYILEFIPAHYLHASGNNHLYDPQAKILFSGDVGAALLPHDKDALFVNNFDEHTQYMEAFHKRWMPSNKARDVWIERVRKLDIEMMCPQHGAIFKDKNVEKFLDWFSELELGSAIESTEEVLEDAA